MNAPIKRSAFVDKFCCFGNDKPLKDWSRRLSSLISTMDVEVDSRAGRFECEWMHIPLGATDLNFISTSGPQTVFHRSNSREYYELLYLAKGPMILNNCEGELALSSGQVVLVSDLQDWTLHFPEDSNTLTMHINKKWIERWLAFPDEALTKPTDHQQIWARPFVSTLQSIYQAHVNNLALQNTHSIADSLGSLAALMLEGGIPLSKRTRFNRKQHQVIEQYLYDHFADSDLTAASTAEALKISVRQLHKLCRNSGKPFAKMLMNIRLNTAKEMLQNSTYQAYQIAEIAWLCGFSDPSHFCRRYKSEFSLTPEAYRIKMANRSPLAPGLIR